MIMQDSTNGLKTREGVALSRTASGNLLVVEPPAEDHAPELDQPDDDVEALIVHMDRTTAEHLFLQATRLLLLSHLPGTLTQGDKAASTPPEA